MKLFNTLNKSFSGLLAITRLFKSKISKEKEEVRDNKVGVSSEETDGNLEREREARYKESLS